jgi:hypothetical protein
MKGITELNGLEQILVHPDLHTMLKGTKRRYLFRSHILKFTVTKAVFPRG